MTGIFKQKNPAIFFLLLLLGILLKLPLFFEPVAVMPDGQEGILFIMLTDQLASCADTIPLIFPILSFTILFVQAVLLSHFINSRRMMGQANFFPGMAFLMITSLYPGWSQLSGAMIAGMFLLIILIQVFSVYNKPKAASRIFNMGLWLGVASFFYPSVLLFFTWLLLALAIMRPFSLREWLLCIAGLLTPFYFYAVYLIFTDRLSVQHFLPFHSAGFPSISHTIWLAGSAFLLLVPLLTGGYHVQDNLRKMLIQVRKGWSILLLFLLLALLVPFVNATGDLKNWVLLAVPLAAFHACTYMYSPFRMYPLLLFWLSAAFIIGYQFYYRTGWFL